MKQTAESIEAEAALVRSQLMAVGADIRQHADPTVIVEAAKSSFTRRVEYVPTFLKENANPLVMVMLGGTFGVVLTGLFSQSRRSQSIASNLNDNYSSAEGVGHPSVQLQAKAALLSGLGVALGYVAGMFVPASSTEERLLGQPKAVLSQHLDDFLKEHARGMKIAAANVFGISRLSAATLVGLAMLAEALGNPRGRSKPDSL
jgi:drug/metabolite transporter (DMT)-like permease